MQSSAILSAPAYRMSISCWLGPTSWWLYSTSMPSFSSASTVSRRTSEPASRVALVRLALGGQDVGEHAGHAAAVLLRPPGKHVEGGRVGHGDHVRLLDGVEAG